MPKLNGKQERIARLVAEGCEHKAIIKEFGVSSATFYRLIDKEHFKAAVNRYRQKIIEQQERQAALQKTIDMTEYVEQAKQVIIDLMLSAERDSTKMQAARYIIDRWEPTGTTPDNNNSFAALMAKMKDKKAKEKV